MAGLRYVSDTKPGIRRKRAGKRFIYLGPDGQSHPRSRRARPVRLLGHSAGLDRRLDFPVPLGHIQATGRDDRHRKQYRYHPQWRTVRDETKYGRMMAFGARLPRIRRRIASDLALPGLPRQKVLATVVRLLETTLIRVGNEEYAQKNRSFGLTTMRDRHVAIDEKTLHFGFRGKSGIYHTIDLADRSARSGREEVPRPARPGPVPVPGRGRCSRNRSSRPT